jgi:hypothetical protein
MTGNDASSDRRGFMKSMAASGLVAAAGIAPSSAQPEAPQQVEAQDPQKPFKGLNPRATLDCRFPVAFETSVPEAMKLAMRYMGALIRRDLAGLASVFHYPFVTYEEVETVIVNSAKELMSNPPPSLNTTGKGRHKIRPGSYDIMDKIEVLLYSPIGVGISLDYSRYRADGQKLFSVYGIYGITNNDGKWGIEYMSTIFRPADQVHLTYDAEAFALRAVHDTFRDLDLANKYGDKEAVRKAHLGPLGKWAGVTLAAFNYPNPDAPAPEGWQMVPYKVKGVKSRLQVSTVTQEMIGPSGPSVVANGVKSEGGWPLAVGSGIGKVTEAFEFPGTRVLNASNEKAHAICGFQRYTEDGTLVSQAYFMSVVLYKDGVWTPVSGPARFGPTVYQDRGNDLRPSEV